MSVPKDIFESIHFDMVRAHQNFTVGFDNIQKHLKNPPMDDLPNFCGYLESWAVAILHHHDSEEETVFPVLNTKMDFSGEHEQHEVLHAFLEKYLELVRSYKKGETEFNATVLLELMDEAKDNFFGHLKDELVHIQPQKLRDAGFSTEEMRDMSAAMTKHAQKTGDPFVVVPFMISHTPPEFKYWPELPMEWLMKKALIPYVFAGRYKGYWKYAPYAMS